MVDFEKFVKKKVEGSEFTEDEIRAKLEKAKEKVENKYPDKSDVFKEETVIKLVARYLDNASNLDVKKISVVRKTGKIDTIAGMRNYAIKQFDKNPQKAIDDGLTNRNGEPIWQSGRNEGEVMPEHIWRKFIYGLDEDNNLVQITVREDLFDLAEKIEPMTKVKMGLNGGDSDDNNLVYYWNLSKYSNPKELEELDPEDLVTRLQDAKAYVDFHDIRAEMPEDGTLPVITRGYADAIYDETPEGQNQRVIFRPADREETVTVWVDEEEEIPFAQNSMIWLLASLSFGDKFREDMEEDPISTARLYAMVPDPGGTLEEGEEDITL